LTILSEQGFDPLPAGGLFLPRCNRLLSCGPIAIDQSLLRPSRPEQSLTQTASTPAPSSPRSPSEWMTAKQAFSALGGNPGDLSSSVSSVDGPSQIKFSTLKKKTSSELKPFRLEQRLGPEAKTAALFPVSLKLFYEDSVKMGFCTRQAVENRA